MHLPHVSDMLLHFEIGPLQRQLGLKIKARFCTF